MKAYLRRKGRIAENHGNLQQASFLLKNPRTQNLSGPLDTLSSHRKAQRRDYGSSKESVGTLCLSCWEIDKWIGRESELHSKNVSDLKEYRSYIGTLFSFAGQEQLCSRCSQISVRLSPLWWISMLRQLTSRSCYSLRESTSLPPLIHLGNRRISEMLHYTCRP